MSLLRPTERQDVAQEAVEQEDRMTSELESNVHRDPKLQENDRERLKAFEAIPHIVDELVLDQVICQPPPSQVPY